MLLLLANLNFCYNLVLKLISLTMNGKIKTGIYAAIILFLGVIGFAVYSAQNYSASFVKEINPNLTDEERLTYENRLDDIDNSLSEDVSKEEQYSLLMQKGFNLYGLGKFAQSADALQQAINLQPEVAGAYVALSQTQSSMNDIKKAKDSIKKALKINPADPNIWKRYIQLEIDKFDISNDQVSALYSEAVNKTSYHVDVISAYASWLEEVGNYQASKEYWQKAIEINPDGKEIYEREIKNLDQFLGN